MSYIQHLSGNFLIPGMLIKRNHEYLEILLEIRKKISSEKSQSSLTQIWNAVGYLTGYVFPAMIESASYAIPYAMYDQEKPLNTICVIGTSALLRILTFNHLGYEIKLGKEVIKDLEKRIYT